MIVYVRIVLIKVHILISFEDYKIKCQHRSFPASKRSYYPRYQRVPSPFFFFSYNLFWPFSSFQPSLISLLRCSLFSCFDRSLSNRVSTMSHYVTCSILLSHIFLKKQFVKKLKVKYQINLKCRDRLC